MDHTRVSKEIDARHRDTETGYSNDPATAELSEIDATLDDDCEIVPGTGDVYRDLAVPHPDLRRSKVLFAIEIMRALEQENLSTRAAQARTGVNHTQFSRIRRANLRHFTIDRLMTILDKLGYDVDVSVAVRKRPV